LSKHGTIISIISEAGIQISFKIDSNPRAALANVTTLLKRPGRTSSTIMAGLLGITPTYPIRGGDLHLEVIRVNFRAGELRHTSNGETVIKKFRDLLDRG